MDTGTGCPPYPKNMRLDNCIPKQDSTITQMNDVLLSHHVTTDPPKDDNPGLNDDVTTAAMSDCSTDICCTQRSCDQIEDLLLDFGKFFRGRFEAELSTFRESMYELLREQHKHLTRIMLPATEVTAELGAENLQVYNCSDLCSEDSGTHLDYCPTLPSRPTLPEAREWTELMKSERVFYYASLQRLVRCRCSCNEKHSISTDNFICIRNRQQSS